MWQIRDTINQTNVCSLVGITIVNCQLDYKIVVSADIFEEFKGQVFLLYTLKETYFREYFMNYVYDVLEEAPRLKDFFMLHSNVHERSTAHKN